MRLDRPDDMPIDPAAERVADFVSAHVGAHESTSSGERAFVRRLAADRQLRRNRKRVAVGAAIAATLVVAGLAGSRFQTTAPAGTVLSYRVDDQDPPSGGYILASQTADALLTFSDGSKVKMAPRARGRVVEVNTRGARFALDDGAVSVDVVPRARAQWIFEAGPFRVNVHGTSFTVAWNPVEAVFHVRLASGAISVASPVAGPEIHMRAGQSLRVNLRDQSSSLGSDVAGSASPAPPRAEPGEPSEPARWPHRGWMAALAKGRAADVVADADRRGLASVLERADSDDLWALANAARYAERHSLARQALSAHRARFPGSGRSREAAFLLGRLHEGDAAGAGEALRWYDRYLAEAQDRAGVGVDVSDALGRKMTLLERSNRRAEALGVARDYLQRNPGGTYANAARALLRSSTAGR
jgi:hypothetical protein